MAKKNTINRHNLIFIKKITALRWFLVKKGSSRPISRVLSSAVIYLDLPLPISSSDLRMNIPVEAPIVYSYLASGGVYTASRVTEGAVSSYLAFSTLPIQAVIFCCTFLKVTFTGISPAPCSCEARTFLIDSFSLSPRSHNRLKK